MGVIEILASLVLISIALVTFTEIALNSIRNNTRSQNKIISTQVAETYTNSAIITLTNTSETLVNFFVDELADVNYTKTTEITDTGVTVTYKKADQEKLLEFLGDTTSLVQMMNNGAFSINGAVYDKSKVSIELTQKNYIVNTDEINTYKLVITVTYNNTQKEVISRDLFFE